jgi:hypothetical protein
MLTAWLMHAVMKCPSTMEFALATETCLALSVHRLGVTRKRFSLIQVKRRVQVCRRAMGAFLATTAFTTLVVTTCRSITVTALVMEAHHARSAPATKKICRRFLLIVTFVGILVAVSFLELVVRMDSNAVTTTQRPIHAQQIVPVCAATGCARRTPYELRHTLIGLTPTELVGVPWRQRVTITVCTTANRANRGACATQDTAAIKGAL